VATRFGFLSTYAPTICGLATFTASLYGELITNSTAPVTDPDRGWVVQVLDAPPTTGNRPRPPRAGREVVGDLTAGDGDSATNAARLLNDCDVAIVQHEYGVYGGPDGDEILPVLRALSTPSVVVLHTVLSEPTAHQREVLNAVLGLADAVVVMTVAAQDRLAAGYVADMSKVSVIPHGAPATRPSYAPMFRTAQPIVLSWGLIGPGKGIEWGIAAMAQLADLNPAPRYIIAGQTHPKVLARDGEAYRQGLQRQVRDLSLEATVSFDSHYRHAASLAELVDTADVVLLPYDSTDQVTSGVLIEAVAALKPVVATGFPHAVELLSDGAGMVVPHQDPAAIAAAIRTLLTRRDVADQMTRAARATAPDILWPAVAQRYRELAEDLIRARIAA
jgi:glycosyltransferase involved in cell wall biosynthesis